jgi:hypothetical protein
MTKRQLNYLLIGLFALFMGVSIVARELAGAAESRVAVGALGLVTAAGLLALSRWERGASRLRPLAAFLVLLGIVLLAVGVRGL